MPNKYFIYRNDKVRGPFSEDRIRGLYAEGKLRDEDLVSTGDEGDWQPLSTVLSVTAPRRQKQRSRSAGETRSRKPMWIAVAAGALILAGFCGWLLIRKSPESVPVVDAGSASVSQPQVSIPEASIPAENDAAESQPLPQAEVPGQKSELRDSGAFGFPQKEATVFCDDERLRLSVSSNSEYLFVQAVLWQDGDDALGKLPDGREQGDNSNLTLDLDSDQSPTANVDRTYCLNPWPALPGLRYDISLGVGRSTGIKHDSKGKGSIQYFEDSPGRKVRVDTFLVPFNELGIEANKEIRLLYWAGSYSPRFAFSAVRTQSVDTEYSIRTPHSDYYSVKLSNAPITYDVTKIPEGRSDRPVTLSNPPALAPDEDTKIVDNLAYLLEVETSILAFGGKVIRAPEGADRIGRVRITLDADSLSKEPHALMTIVGLLKELDVAIDLYVVGHFHESNRQALTEIASVRSLQKLTMKCFAPEGVVNDSFLHDLRDVSTLYSLEVYGDAVTDAGFAEIATFPELQELRSFMHKVSDAGIAALANNKTIARLSLFNQTTEKSIAIFESMQALHILHIHGISIDNQLLRKLKARRPELCVVRSTDVREQGLTERLLESSYSPDIYLESRRPSNLPNVLQPLADELNTGFNDGKPFEIANDEQSFRKFGWNSLSDVKLEPFEGLESVKKPRSGAYIKPPQYAQLNHVLRQVKKATLTWEVHDGNIVIVASSPPSTAADPRTEDWLQTMLTHRLAAGLVDYPDEVILAVALEDMAQNISMSYGQGRKIKIAADEQSFAKSGHSLAPLVNLKVRNLKLPPQSLADSLKQTIAKVPELDLSYVIKDDTILIIAN